LEHHDRLGKDEYYVVFETFELGKQEILEIFSRIHSYDDKIAINAKVKVEIFKFSGYSRL